MKIPRPFAIAIDDMGWMDGENEGWQGQNPYRVGIRRKMDISDYEAVVSLAKKTGIRLQGLFILGELDREDAARKFPTILPPLSKWRNEKSPLQLQVMDYVKANAAHLEFGLHGVGHEYWPDRSNVFKRAEWYNLVDKEAWPEQSIKNHLNCFKEIMAQYELDSAHNQSFPQSFVPCAYSYYWNPSPAENEYSLGAVLAEYGVKYANTDFTVIPELNPPVDGGFDKGVHVLNRFNYGNLWHMIGQLPLIPVKYQNTDFIETHWPNLLAQDHFLQADVTKKWVDYYRNVNASENRYCSKNTAQHHSQFLYKKYTSINKVGDSLHIDNSKMPDNAEHESVLQNLVLKIPIKANEHLQYISLNGKPIPAYHEIDDFAYLYLPKLSREIHVLNYSMSKSLPQNIVWHDTTCNILKLETKEDCILIGGYFYGKQTLQFLTDRSIKSVSSNNPLLKIISWSSTETGLSIDFEAKDIQGVEADIRLQLKYKRVR